MEWRNYVNEKLAGKFFTRYAILCLLITFWVFQQEGKKIWYSLRQEKKKIFWQTIKLLFFFTLIHFALKLVLGWVAPPSWPNLKSEKINTHISVITSNKNNWGYLAQIFFGMCVLAPIVEECIFRYFIFRIFGRKNPFSYLLSFLTFIGAHYHRGENLFLLFFQYSVATWGFIYVYKKSGWKLLSPILLHSLTNLLFIVIVLINPSCSLI
ncbi:CPBP family intramembrane glutamic endopeptidase [endosymbiont DhMRE of Dentiscutata heterogama]|uniref:CPBP family intramembrane glutamic endopeptidase n=1 Tax=endosymbiont DhMRE of Dentiscutata heterogama TaxID=1609546 RepID=UPI002AD20516|nr:CPBP family intramembrane glutamic endopeptidase [endosymbiont DhMRE of Dentiscutata heterogama]